MKMMNPIIYFYLKILRIGNVIQAAISYYANVFQKLNSWINKLNLTILKPFGNEMHKKYIFKYPMYSDIFYSYKFKQYQLYYYNISEFKTILKTLTKQQRLKIKKICEKSIDLLTNDILALLNIYKHFKESPAAINYIERYGKNFNNKSYIINEYFQNEHLLLNNYNEILQLLKE